MLVSRLRKCLSVCKVNQLLRTTKPYSRSLSFEMLDKENACLGKLCSLSLAANNFAVLHL